MRTGSSFDVRDYGASGTGTVLDGAAIQSAITAAHAAGGGIVVLPPGRYLSFSLRLLSRVTLAIEPGATLIAATPGPLGAYDLPEDRGPQLYQDFGHSHWNNSLIWAEDAEDISVLGGGRIDGHALTRDGPGTPWKPQSGERPLSMAAMTEDEVAALERTPEAMRGLGNKAIALAHCRRVAIRDLTIDRGGHIALLAGEVENLTLSKLTIDTIRDGIDLDCVRRATVEGCRVNSPNDDAIVLKTSLGLGRRSACEDVTIRDCTVSGYDVGTLLDGALGRTQRIAPDRDPVTGRIKLGTESNGDFRRIRVTGCRFERSRGLAIESVDGGTIEDVRVEGVTMEEVTTAPLFLRLGARLRGPEGTMPGAIRGVSIEGLTATGIDPRFAATIAGIAGHRIEDVTLSDVTLHYAGAIDTLPADPPELADAYPEPSMFGPTPAWGLWARHVRGLDVRELTLSRDGEDGRPRVKLDDTEGPSLPRSC
ncbi:exo-poly-alpha-D-galacturonosidase [Sphingomonas sp. Leaf33]|uniref:rhamnogalacturonidase n=1 Tax=Sphingomonas sp. Leaf33 TaxID=1736215 RepID=UPI0006FD83BF|nr:glycosyl hydrolase family 28-related protein [Sphingomonas sp. Leaf33]KQN25669.1 exo-poly-alpha-D-galacturonosidase [Sphingomonas sp. Leaf33]